MYFISLFLFLITIYLISLLFIKIKGLSFYLFFIIIISYFILIPLDIIPKIILFITLFIFYYILSFIIIKKSNDFSMYFGVPGSGKSTIAAYLANKDIKKYNKKNKNYKVWSNVNIKNTYIFEKNDIGRFNIENGTMIYDEVSFDFNNRNYKKNFNDKQLKWFKLHRHYNVNIHMFSQAYDDADKKLRDLTTSFYYIDKSIIPFLIYFKRLKPKFTINKDTHQPEFQYKWVIFSSYYVFMPTTWKLFNSFEKENLLSKKWEKRI